jgi:hypothetical protein
MTDGDGRDMATGAAGSPAAKRPYHSPVLTRYGSVEELVDAGVVGSAPSGPPAI